MVMRHTNVINHYLDFFAGFIPNVRNNDAYFVERILAKTLDIKLEHNTKSIVFLVKLPSSHVCVFFKSTDESKYCNTTTTKTCDNQRVKGDKTT
jgi:hypothetical protein